MVTFSPRPTARSLASCFGYDNTVKNMERGIEREGYLHPHGDIRIP